MQQNINSQFPTLGEKKRQECCSGRENCSYYLLALFNCNIPVCITACSREAGEFSSRSIQKIFLDDMCLCTESD